MLRTFVCAVLALTLVTGVSLAAQKDKKTSTVTGTIKKIDAKEGTLTVSVKTKKTDTDKEFKIGADTRIIVGTDGEKKELVGKAGLKNEQLKEGALVTVTTDEADATKVKEVRLRGPAGKKKKDK